MAKEAIIMSTFLVGSRKGQEELGMIMQATGKAPEEKTSNCAHTGIDQSILLTTGTSIKPLNMPQVLGVQNLATNYVNVCYNLPERFM